MREIKFRGKKVDVDEWVYGFYMEDNFDKPLIITNARLQGKLFIEVIPETVGICLGIKDINDSWIYEDDILKRVKSNGTYYKKVYHVKNYSNQSIPRFDPIFFQSDNKFEKIGNKFDNSTLLESVK